jgi:hypothetical protein
MTAVTELIAKIRRVKRSLVESVKTETLSR